MISVDNQSAASIVFTMREWMGVRYPRTLCHFNVGKHGYAASMTSAVLVDNAVVLFQVDTETHEVGVFLDCEPYASRRIEIRFQGQGADAATTSSGLLLQIEGATRLCLADGALDLPPQGRYDFVIPVDSLTVPAPVQRLTTVQGRSFGIGILDTYERVKSYQCQVVDDGPLWARCRIDYQFDSGGWFEVDVWAVVGEPFARFAERASCGQHSRWILQFDEASGFLPDSMDLADHTLFYAERHLDYFSDRLHARLYPWTQGSQIASLREGVAVHATASDLWVAWFTRSPEMWDGFKNTFIEFYERRYDTRSPRTRSGESPGSTFSWLPDGDTRDFTDSQSVFCAESMLLPGSKHYALLIGNRAAYHQPSPVPEHTLEWYEGPALLEAWNAQRSPLRALLQFQGLLSLDTVKDWVLQGDAVKTGLPKLVHGHPVLEHSLDLKPGVDKLRAMDQALSCLASGYLMARGAGGTNPVMLRVVYPWAIAFREMMYRDEIPDYFPEEIAGGRVPTLPRLEDRLAARFAFLGYLADQRSFYPGEYTLAPMGAVGSSEPVCLGMPNQNFFTDVYCMTGGIALMMPWHPCAGKWLARANRMLSMQLDRFSNPDSGVWEESHTYFNHVLRTLVMFMWEQREQANSRDGLAGSLDWFADLRFQRLCAAALHLVTPRDRNAGGLRMMAPLGDHGMELRWHTFHALAMGLVETIPTLAGALSWLSVENGWKGTLHVVPVKPCLASRRVQGLGAVRRGLQDGACGGESLVVLRAGSSWAHYHCDELEVLYYSGGEPVLVEAGYGRPETFEKKGPQGHNIMCPVKFTPAYYLSRANRGDLDEWSSGDGAATISAHRQVAFALPEFDGDGVLLPLPVMSYRQSRKVEWNESADDAGLSTLHIIDEHDGPYAQQLFFHTGGTNVRQLKPGVCLITGETRDSLLMFDKPVDIVITPDASGLTIGVHVVLQPLCKKLSTWIHTAPHGHPIFAQNA